MMSNLITTAKRILQSGCVFRYEGKKSGLHR